MPIYENKRAVICTIPSLALKPAPTLAGILDDLEGQIGSERMKSLVCNIMQHGSKAFLLHLASPDQIPEFIAHGYTFRGHQLNIQPVKSTTIVVLDRVPYGLPSAAITTAVVKYGTVSSLKAITHKGYGMSKYRLEIELKQDIPSRINIQGNPLNVFYKNQPRSCFVCREAGHEARNCPRKGGPARFPDPPPATRSFTEIAAGAKPLVIPTPTDNDNPDPPSAVESRTKSKEGGQPEMDVEESSATKTSEIVPPAEGESILPPPPPAPVPPALPAVVPESSCDQTVVPPVNDENVSLPSTIESSSDAHPPPVLDIHMLSMTEVPPSPDLLKQFENTPPRPSNPVLVTYLNRQIPLNLLSTR